MGANIRIILGVLMLLVGLGDLLRVGFFLLLMSPKLLVGLLLTGGGAALIASGRRAPY